MDEYTSANDCIIEILESYMQFVDIMDKTLKKYAQMPKTIEALSNTLIQRAKNAWQPILDDAKKRKQ